MIDVPALTPVTRPVVLIVATELVTLLHTPPAARSVNWVVPVGHTVVIPEIDPALGEGLTVTTVVAAAVPQLLVTA